MPLPARQIASLIRQYYSQTGKLLSIGTVESATGGRIANKITDVPGSSEYFKGSIVAYSNEIKKSVVGVKPETLNLYGAVSIETAQEMALCGRTLLDVDICIADTGIAGPGGSTTEKPVGLFYLCLAHEDSIRHQKHVFSGSRDLNKQQATTAALNLLENYLLSLLDNRLTR